jgi:hypothetical protein
VKHNKAANADIDRIFLVIWLSLVLNQNMMVLDARRFSNVPVSR